MRSLGFLLAERGSTHCLLDRVGSSVQWGHLDLLSADQETGAERSRLYLSVPGPLQTVQRAELLLGLSSFWLMVIFLSWFKMLVEARGPRTAAVSKVKGHADEGLMIWLMRLLTFASVELELMSSMPEGAFLVPAGSGIPLCVNCIAS